MEGGRYAVYNMPNNSSDLPNYLPGNPEMYGVRQQADQYFQGVDIIIEASLVENQSKVDYNDYSLKAVLKADLDSPTVVWYGYPNYGVFFNNGKVQINIPANITRQLPAGVFYLTIIGKSKTNVNHLAVLFNKTISIVLSAASSISTIAYDVWNLNPTGVVIHSYSPVPDASVEIQYFSI